MKKKGLACSIFSISAIFPFFIVDFMFYMDGYRQELSFLTFYDFMLKEISFSRGYKFMLVPACCAFVSTYFLGSKIRYYESKSGNSLEVSLFFSMLIVIGSLILWSLVLMVTLPLLSSNTHSNGTYEIAGIALLAGTIYGWITYPPGIIAGWLVWYISKVKKRS